MQYSTGTKAMLYVQHSTDLGQLRLTVMWVTGISTYNSLPVRVTAEGKWSVKGVKRSKTV